MKTLAVLSNRAGAGATTLAFNLGWALAHSGFRVLLVDLDPQAELTARAGVGPDVDPRSSLPMLLSSGRGDGVPHALAPTLALLRSGIELSLVDDDLGSAWVRAQTGDESGRSETDRLGAAIDTVAQSWGADLVICDLGPTVGPLNRAAALRADRLVIPIVPDPSMAAGLASLGTALGRWRQQWHGISGEQRFAIAGYVLVQRPRGAHARPSASEVSAAFGEAIEPTSDPYLGTLKAYPGLHAMAREARAALFDLTGADGALGAHAYAVRDVWEQYAAIGSRVVDVIGLVDETLVDRAAQALYAAMTEGTLPAELDSLSSQTTIDIVEAVELESVQIERDGLRIRGSASVCVDLHWGDRRDSSEASMSFPFQFDVELDSSHESVGAVHELVVDTSSFYE